MTRQERLEALAYAMSCAWTDGNACAGMARGGIETLSRLGAVDAASWGHEALDHLAALEQQAIDAYLSNVPLPEGWTEDAVPAAPGFAGAYHYSDEEGYTRVSVVRSGFDAAMTPRHWPPIPLPVLIRAAVQCHRLREGK